MGAGLGGLPPVSAETRPASDPVEVTDGAPAADVFAAHPSISDDGRWLVTSGLPLDGSERASTIWLLDRAADAPPVELTHPLEGLRTGSSVMPSISGDGCVVAIVTELPFDLFRDDDGGARWDVYRLVLPHCGGQPDRWELVSTTDDRDGISAMDYAVPDTAPTMSLTGTEIAFAHRATMNDNETRTAISVVDITVPLGQSGHIELIAGTPMDAPNTTFRYRGLREPSMSADARYIAFTSDAVSDIAEPTWGDGPVGGGFATSRVYVWDRMAEQPLAAVRRVAGTAAGADTDQPVISGNGQFIAFRSAHPGLVVEAEYPACIESCPGQIYRFDQTAGVTLLVSHRPFTLDGPIIAAERGGSQPAITDDGTQVAFITRSDDLFSTHAAAGADPSDGDLVVADVDLGVIRRVSVQADGVTPAPATHAHPAMSATGHVVVIDTLAANALTGSSEPGRRVVALSRTPTLAFPHLDVGTIAVGFPGPEWYIAVLNEGPSTFLPAEVTSTNPDFAITGGTCGLGEEVAPGKTCTVNITLTPSKPGPITGELTVASALPGGGSVTTILSGAGGEPTLAPSPAGADLEATVVGKESASVSFDVGNIGFAEAVIAKIEVAGANPDDFIVKSNSCIGRTVHMGGICALEVAFTPKQAGYRTASIIVSTTAGQYTGVLVNGTGKLEPTIDVAAETVRAGDSIGVGIGGFPSSSEVRLFWADGSGRSLAVVTNPDGSLLTEFPTRRNERGGERELVAQSGDVVAKVSVRVQRSSAGVNPASPAWGG